MKNYQFFEMPLIEARLTNETEETIKERKKTNPESPRLVILRGGLGEADPQRFMDSVVALHVQDYAHNQFVEYTLDNPWVRVLIFGINELQYEERSFKE